MYSRLSLAVCLVLSLNWSAAAVAQEAEEWDPSRPDAEERLKEFDKAYEEATGQPTWLPQPNSGFDRFMSEVMTFATSCYQDSCNIFARVSKRNQKLYLSVNGTVQNVYTVSTGAPGHGTPNMDQHPNGRIYDKYSSSAYPGGDWNGLGNMPYAVFIRGGYAIHGTPEANWPKLGQPASHGCIRVHPLEAKAFNRLVRANGIANTWITVEP
jgi:hypothetical protein